MAKRPVHRALPRKPEAPSEWQLGATATSQSGALLCHEKDRPTRPASCKEIDLSINRGAPKGARAHTMSPPLQGCNPPNPQPDHSRPRRPNFTNRNLPERNRYLTELQNEVGRLVSAHLTHRKRDLFYYSARRKVVGLLAEFAGHVARVIGIPGEPSCRHVGNRGRVAAGWGVQQRKRHLPLRAGRSGEGPGTAQIVLKED